MVGGRDQQRKAGRRIGQDSFQRRGDRRAGRLDRSAADRSAAPSAIRSGCWVRTCTRSTSGAASSAATGRCDHRHAADRDQRLEVGSMGLRRTDRRPAATRRGRSAVQRSCQPADRPAGRGRAGRWPGPAERHGRSATAASTARPARCRGRAGRAAGERPGSPCSGLRRAVISRNWLSTCCQTWMCMP